MPQQGQLPGKVLLAPQLRQLLLYTSLIFLPPFSLSNPFLPFVPLS